MSGKIYGCNMVLVFRNIQFWLHTTHHAPTCALCIHSNILSSMTSYSFCYTKIDWHQSWIAGQDWRIFGSLPAWEPANHKNQNFLCEIKLSLLEYDINLSNLPVFRPVFSRLRCTGTLYYESALLITDHLPVDRYCDRSTAQLYSYDYNDHKGLTV